MGLSAERDDANIPQQNRANINPVADNWFIPVSLSLYLRTLLCEIKAGVCLNIMAGFQKGEKEREQGDTLTLG